MVDSDPAQISIFDDEELLEDVYGNPDNCSNLDDDDEFDNEEGVNADLSQDDIDYLQTLDQKLSSKKLTIKS